MHWSYVFINLIILLLLSLCSPFPYQLVSLNLFSILFIGINACLSLSLFDTIIFNALNFMMFKNKLANESMHFTFFTFLLIASYVFIF